MNYYEHHIGDYDQATAHLSAVEDGIYSRLIRWYMANEGPLPSDIKTIQRRVRAHSRDERAAVQTILAEFFELREGLYHQHRCDEEVSRYQGKQAKARASAEARWGGMRSASERNANASPNDDAPDMRTHSSSNANGMHRAPVPTLQTPSTKEEENPPASRVPPVASPRASKKCPESFVVTPELRQWAGEKTPGVNVDAETETLRDHTFATARSDWAGTWRNWMRKAAGARPGQRPVNGSDDPFAGAH